MDCRVVVMGLWITSVAVSVAARAAELPYGPYRTCAVIALCLGFHLGIALVIVGVRCARAPPPAVKPADEAADSAPNLAN